MDVADFNPIDYINSLFPTEQSLSNIDQVIVNMEEKVQSIDSEIRNVVRQQTNMGQVWFYQVSGYYVTWATLIPVVIFVGWTIGFIRGPEGH